MVPASSEVKVKSGVALVSELILALDMTGDAASYSYAPMSVANPRGLAVPRKSVVIPKSAPVSIAGEED